MLEDSLRADRLSCYGYQRKTTPVKDAFAKTGVVFFNAFSQATYTRASYSSFMTSLYPAATNVWNISEQLDNHHLTLAEIMRSQGFATASFTQNIHTGPYAGNHQGFSTLVDGEAIGHRAYSVYGGTAMRQWLDMNADRNFFLYLHLTDPHAPYSPTAKIVAPYKNSSIGGTKRVQKNDLYDPDWLHHPTVESRRFLYDEEISFNDLCFRNMLTRLKKDNLLEDTMIVFISDHGEHLAEHSLLWGHQPPGYIQVLHVPLIVVYPKKLPYDKKIIQPVQLLDIMPTILDIADINKGNLLLEGDSLLPLINGENPDYWNNRLCISEEVRFKRGKPNVYGSIFYRNWHILNSEDLNDNWSNQARKFSKDLYENLFRIRVFNPTKDMNEHYDHPNFLFDFYFNNRVNCFMQELRKHNINIWKNLKGTEHDERAIKYDQDALDQLRSLGYIE